MQEYTPGRDPIIANGQNVESNLFKGPPLQFIIEHILENDLMFVNMSSVASLSAM